MNAELISMVRSIAKHGADWRINEVLNRAADALEAADKRIAELEAQMLKIKSRIYDLESMAKREYDDDHDNEYLEGYFDGLHQAAKLISTTLSTEKR